jgi:CheY-like chemotaxis protein
MSASGSAGTDSEAAEPCLLIVEDYADLAVPLARLLRRSGYRAEVATSGNAAIRFLQSHRPALVILDLLLPDISGLEILRQLREQFPDLPVIINTGSIDEDVLRTCAELGATEIWIKGTLDFFLILRRLSKYAPGPGQSG